MTIRAVGLRSLLLALLVLSGCDSGTVAPSPSVDLSAPWATAPPEHLDLDPAAMAEAIRLADAIPRFRSLLVVRRGWLAVESYFHGASEATLHDVRSVTKSVVGMLAGIAIERDPVALARAWHVEPEDRFDFSSGPERVEVKSTSGETRRHHFSLEQVRPEADMQVLVVSVRVVRAADGLALGGLLDRTRGLLAGDADLLLHVDHVVAESLGGSLRRALRERFDEEVARASLQLYRAEDIPAVDPDLPPGVSGVRFTAELDQVRPLGQADLGKEGLHSMTATCIP